jgi:hypothetical protein
MFTVPFPVVVVGVVVSSLLQELKLNTNAATAANVNLNFFMLFNFLKVYFSIWFRQAQPNFEKINLTLN